MKEDIKKEIAQFRFGVIADLTGWRKLTRGERERILRDKTVCEWKIPYSERSYISRSTILNWLKRYEGSGGKLESLYPRDRTDKGRTRVIKEEEGLCLINLKKELKGASLPAIMTVARQRKILPLNFRVSYATIYRFFQRNGLMDDEQPQIDRRRFEAELPNEIWQSDCMHGPRVEVDGKMRKTFLFAFIDDMSRLIPHAEFYLNERIDSYIDALEKAIAKRGLPGKLYLDNAPSFRSQLLSHATASLAIALIHSRAYQPEGRGKIERWFKTVRMQFLSTIPDGLNLKELNERLRQWIEKHYHQEIHSSTKEAPLSRYLKHIHLIREAPRNLNDYFRKRVLRKVHKDRTIAVAGRIYEAPVELIGKTAVLLYHEQEPSRIEIFYNNKSYGMLVALNVNINCKIRRINHITELTNERQKGQSLEGENQYRGGSLFEKGKEDEQL
jgi:putative transposase